MTLCLQPDLIAYFVAAILFQRMTKLSSFLISSRLLIVRRATIFLILPRCPFFETTRYFTSLPRTLVQIYLRTLLFARTSFDLKMITPLFSCATYQARSFKFMPRWSRQEQHGVRKDSLNLPRFYSRIQVQFSFLPRSAFCSFTLCILRQFLFSQSRFLVRRFTIFYFCEVLYCFFRDILFLAVFKMGVKMFRPFTIFPCSPRFSSFVASQYL